MGPRPKSFLLILAAALMLLKPTAVSACECLDYSVAGAKKASRAVFVGTVLEKDDGGVVRFAVEKLWKGDDFAELKVASGYGLCAAYFEVGKTYLVYAYWDERERRLSTDHCIRTRAVENTEDLKRLGKPKVIRTGRDVKR